MWVCPALAGQYFAYRVINWLGEELSNKGNDFQIIELKKDRMILKSYSNAKYEVEYEFAKIK